MLPGEVVLGTSVVSTGRRRAVMDRALEFLRMQNARIEFYNNDFWEIAKFFSALLTLLLSFPVALWLKDSRPLWWSLAAAWAPCLGLLVSIVAYTVLRRVAVTYYSLAASIFTLETSLDMHRTEVQGVARNVVDESRRAHASVDVDCLRARFLQRLRLCRFDSRMGIILKLFLAYAIFSLGEACILLVHGITGINVLAALARRLG